MKLLLLAVVAVFVLAAETRRMREISPELEEILQRQFVEQELYKCKQPRAKVLRIKDLYKKEGQSKRFMPHCVILHRCADDTGCCPEGETCEAKVSQVVTKTILVTDLFGFTVPKRLTFRNDTECQCRSLADPPRIHHVTTIQPCFKCQSIKDNKLTGSVPDVELNVSTMNLIRRYGHMSNDGTTESKFVTAVLITLCLLKQSLTRTHV